MREGNRTDWNCSRSDRAALNSASCALVFLCNCFVLYSYFILASIKQSGKRLSWREFEEPEAHSWSREPSRNASDISEGRQQMWRPRFNLFSPFFFSLVKDQRGYSDISMVKRRKIKIKEEKKKKREKRREKKWEEEKKWQKGKEKLFKTWLLFSSSFLAHNLTLKHRKNNASSLSSYCIVKYFFCKLSWCRLLTLRTLTVLQSTSN